MDRLIANRKSACQVNFGELSLRCRFYYHYNSNCGGGNSSFALWTHALATHDLSQRQTPNLPFYFSSCWVVLTEWGPRPWRAVLLDDTPEGRAGSGSEAYYPAATFARLGSLEKQLNRIASHPHSFSEYHIYLYISNW